MPNTTQINSTKCYYDTKNAKLRFFRVKYQMLKVKKIKVNKGKLTYKII